MRENFQIIVLGLFAFFLVAGVIAFATFRGGSGAQAEPVTIWGTLPQEDVDRLITVVRQNTDGFQASYREIRPELFDSELVEALASGQGPDLMFLPQDLILRHEDKVYLIPFESLSEREFRDRFIEAGELYLRPDGIIGLPFSVDPMVLYWNRTLFNNAGIAEPPMYWDEFATLAQRLSEIDERGNVLQSAIALGEFTNINHAKEILAALIMQAGSPITLRDEGGIDVVLGERFSFPERPAESALRFYTEFANPVKLVYSWNRSLPAARNMFLAGDVAMYVGFAREAFELQSENPNLNFDIAPVPQVRGGEARLVFGTMHGLAILRSSPRISSAFRALASITDPTSLAAWERETGLPPVRRDMLAEAPTDAYRNVFYTSALVADAFLDPNPRETDAIFRTMIEDVTSGRSSITNAVSRASDRLESLAQKQ